MIWGFSPRFATEYFREDGELDKRFGLVHHYKLQFRGARGHSSYSLLKLQSRVWAAHNRATINKSQAESLFWWASIMTFFLSLTGSECELAYEAHCRDPEKDWISPLDFVEQRGHDHYMQESGSRI